MAAVFDCLGVFVDGPWSAVAVVYDGPGTALYLSLLTRLVHPRLVVAKCGVSHHLPQSPDGPLSAMVAVFDGLGEFGIRSPVSTGGGV